MYLRYATPAISGVELHNSRRWWNAWSFFSTGCQVLKGLKDMLRRSGDQPTTLGRCQVEQHPGRWSCDLRCWWRHQEQQTGRWCFCRRHALHGLFAVGILSAFAVGQTNAWCRKGTTPEDKASSPNLHSARRGSQNFAYFIDSLCCLFHCFTLCIYIL